MQSKKKTLNSALLISAIFLVSCSNFDWEPKPWVGDHNTQAIVNDKGETINTDQPAFSTYTCFDPENIAELKTAIDQVRNNKARKRLKKSFAIAFPQF